eukprot:gene11744-gene12614
MRSVPGCFLTCCTMKRKSSKVSGVQRCTRMLCRVGAAMKPVFAGSSLWMSSRTSLKHLRRESRSRRSARDVEMTAVAVRLLLTSASGLDTTGSRFLNSKSTSARFSFSPPSAMNKSRMSVMLLPTPPLIKQRRNSSKGSFVPWPITMCEKALSNCRVFQPITRFTTSFTDLGGLLLSTMRIDDVRFTLPVSAHCRSHADSMNPESAGSKSMKMLRASRSLNGRPVRLMSETNSMKLICFFMLSKTRPKSCTQFANLRRSWCRGELSSPSAPFLPPLTAGRNSEFIIHIANSSKSIVPLRSESKTLKMRSTSGCGKITPNLMSVNRNSLGVTCPDSPILFRRI